MGNIIREEKIEISINRLIIFLLIFLLSNTINAKVPEKDLTKLGTIYWNTRKHNPFVSLYKFEKDTNLHYKTLFQIKKRDNPKSVKLDIKENCVKYDFGKNISYFEKKKEDTIFIFMLEKDVYYFGIYLIDSKFLLLFMEPAYHKGKSPQPDLLGYLISSYDLNVQYYIKTAMYEIENVNKVEHEGEKIFCKSKKFDVVNRKYDDKSLFENRTIASMIDLINKDVPTDKYLTINKYKNLFRYYFWKENTYVCNCGG